jgi:hypothetical protein
MKNILIGVGMLVLAFYLLWEQGKQQQDFAEKRKSLADQNGSMENEDPGIDSSNFNGIASTTPSVSDQNYSQSDSVFSAPKKTCTRGAV